MRTRTAWLLVALALTAPGCDSGNSAESSDLVNTEKAQEPSFPAGKPLTWEQWKRQEAPTRETVSPHRERIGYQRFGPAPNRARWKPADFLPDEALQAEHVDLCELPLANRREVAKLWRWANNERESLERDEVEAIARRYAQQGVVQAQASMSMFHDPDPDAATDPTPKTRRTVAFLEKAAASGTADAMLWLGEYQMDILKSMEGRYDPYEIVPRTDFRWDEVFYWYWRAAKGFHEMGLLNMASDQANYTWKPHQAPGDAWPSHLSYRRAIRQYKWTRLNDLIETLTPGYGEHRHITEDVEEVLEEWPEFTKNQRAVAEQEVGDFLRDNKKALARYRRPFGCPDMTWLDPNAPSFDWDALNKEIEQYGIQVEPVGKRWDVRDEWPPSD